MPDSLHVLTLVCAPLSQVEFIVMGGTFLSLDVEYRDFFIRNLHDALSGHTSNSVEEAIAYSEQSNTKCIAITIETRPDYCLKPHLNSMLQVRWPTSCVPASVHVGRCCVLCRGFLVCDAAPLHSLFLSCGSKCRWPRSRVSSLTCHCHSPPCCFAVWVHPH